MNLKKSFLHCPCSGSITIYLALTITIVMSLLFCIIESARITSLKCRNKATTYLSLDCAFSHFALQLYDKYGVFGVFSTEETFLSVIKDYAQKNSNPKSVLSYSSFSLTKSDVSDISYNNIFHLTDRDGLIFARQAVAFEKYRSASDYISKLTNIENKLSSSSDVKPGTITDNSILVSDSNIASLDDNRGDSNLYKTLSFGEASSLKNNIVSKVVELIKSNLLLLFIDNPYTISSTAIPDDTAAKLPSSTCVLSENAKSIQEGSTKDTVNAMTDKILFVSYIGNSFSSYLNEVNSDISLKYQKEYVLCGNTSDNENLLSAALSIVSLRASSNLMFLLKDSEKRGAAFNLADSICVNMPVISEIAAFTILSAWAYAEGIIDTKDLFSGKKVPLFKSDNNWTLSLEGILTLNKNTISNNDGKQGYSYDEYLDICLLLSDCYTNYFRCMDLIQLDICENCNPNFLMSACITGADINVTYTSSPLFTGLIKAVMPQIYTYSTDMLYAYD